MQNYIGVPPNCRPECSINSDCPADKACIREKCRDPCPGSCGLLARCSVINHTPSCVCPEGYTGDPFVGCNTMPQIPRKNSVFRDIIIVRKFVSISNRRNSIYIHISVPPPDRCNPSPCGQNARCNDGICTCISEYFGDPYVGCRPECVINTDCSRDKACMLQKCRDPCVGVCGFNAECNVINHLPMCSCPRNMTGNAFISCTALQGLYAPTAIFCNSSLFDLPIFNSRHEYVIIIKQIRSLWNVNRAIHPRAVRTVTVVCSMVKRFARVSLDLKVPRLLADRNVS